MSEQWTQVEAVQLCIEIERVCPTYGCHVALTGGLLYKPGPRKDCDLLIYRIRQWGEIDMEGLWAALSAIGVEKTSGFGWCYKATYKGKQIDFLFPEETGGEYVKDE